MDAYKINKIERCSGISEKEFYNKFVKKSIPVVICDKAKWVFSEKCTPEYFKKNYNHVTKVVNGTKHSLSEIIELCQNSTPTNKAPYPNIYDIPKHFPEYLDLIPKILYGKSNRIFSKLLPNIIASRNNQIEFFFGGYGCSFPYLHIDYNWVHTQLTQVIGEKDFILYPPSQTKYLYPDKDAPNKSPVNIINPDYEKYPEFKNAKSVKVTLKPGETIFIPSGWWHTTYIHNFNLTFAVDHVNKYNWNTFLNKNYDVAKKHIPKVAWSLKIYKVIFGTIFNIKEFLFNKLK